MSGTESKKKSGQSKKDRRYEIRHMDVKHCQLNNNIALLIPIRSSDWGVKKKRPPKQNKIKNKNKTKQIKTDERIKNEFYKLPRLRVFVGIFLKTSESAGDG